MAKGKPTKATSYDDAQAYRVWALTDNDWAGWQEGARFRYLQECLDYCAYLWDRGIVYVYQTPMGCETINPATDPRPVAKGQPCVTS